MQHKESDIQRQVVSYIRAKWPRLLFTASTSGVKLPIRTAINLKRMGSIAGVPDLLIFKARNGFNGLLLELKIEKGTLSPNQKFFLDMAASEGYRACCAYGYNQAIKIIDEYLG